MLDLIKLLPQFTRLLQLGAQESLEDEAAVSLCQEVIREIDNNPEAFHEKLASSEDKTFFDLAIPVEDFSLSKPMHYASIDGVDYTVFSADGSQILPSQHAISSCFLINIGSVAITYGNKPGANLSSIPYLYKGANCLNEDKTDVYLPIGKDYNVDEAYLKCLRFLLELDDIVRQADEKETQITASQNVTVALVDGTISSRLAQQLEPMQRTAFLKQLKTIFDRLYDLKVIPIGYISASKSVELVNTLRIAKCPYQIADCQKHCSRLKPNEYPCQQVASIVDRQCLYGLLADNCRTNIFASARHNSNLVGDKHELCFCYANFGSEIARLEFPRWLSDNINDFDYAMTVINEQVQKGLGYPIALSEAHNFAVVRGVERENFYRLLETKLVEEHQRNIKVSAKEERKRYTPI